MKNGEAIRYICENINKYNFIKRVNLREQELNDESQKNVIEMLEKNESIEYITFGLCWNLISF